MPLTQSIVSSSNTAVTTLTIINSSSDVESAPRSAGLPAPYPSSPLNPASRPVTARSSTMSTIEQPVKTKKKPSFLGTLFTKEPSTAAFLHMQNETRRQLAVTAGRNVPPGMSGVSSVQIPENVPKVNSKWDGMPRKSEERGKGNSCADFRRISTLTSSLRSRSVDTNGRKRHSRRVSDSTTSSGHPSCERSLNSAHQDDNRFRPDEADSRAESVSSRRSIKHPLSSGVSLQSQSLRPQSGIILPQSTWFLPKSIPETPDVPHLCGAPALATDHGTKDVTIARNPYFESVPDLVSSPSSTPLAQSPITPFSDTASEQHLDQSDLQNYYSLAGSVSEFTLNEALLRAGEARQMSLSDKEMLSVQPNPTQRNKARSQRFAPTVLVQQDLEKRPDSSRARLGLRASIIRTADAAPWELKGQEIQQDLEKRPDSSRARLGLRASMIRGADAAPWELKGQEIQQDLEKRPDSSRARLGLRASMIRNADAAPWEWDDERRPLSDSLTKSSAPKHLLPKSLGLFGKV